jgi:hypothetical protein
LEEAMEVVEQGTCSLQGVSWIFHIPLSSFSDHMIGCTRSKKMGPLGVFIEEEDVATYKWTLAMGECGLSIF